MKEIIDPVTGAIIFKKDPPSELDALKQEVKELRKELNKVKAILKELKSK